MITCNNRRGNLNYFSNQGSLLDDQFATLPLGSVTAGGWLKNQLILQKNLTNAMEYYPDYNSESAWLGGSGEDWERGPYYVRGLVSLAYALDDAELKNKAQKWIDWSIDSQRDDGFFGPESNTDWWPRMPMLMAIRDYYEATCRQGNPDSRVIDFIVRYFRYQLKMLPANPLQSWAAARGGDNIDSVYWLYNRIYNPSDPEASSWLLDLAQLLKEQTQNWTDIFTNTTVREHVVNTSQAMKMPILYYQQSKSEADRDALFKGLLNISIDHGRIDGLPNSDEAARDNKSTRGTELCGIVESMLSTEIALRILGDSSLGDHLEKLAYNPLPAAFAPDYLSHVYFILQNQVMATTGYHGFDCDHGDSSAFGAPDGFDCCFSNGHMGWPKFVQSMWMATNDNGLALTAYGPNTVKAEVSDGKEAAFTQTTNYPFDDSISLKYSGEDAFFPLKIRIPKWCSSPSVKVNGQVQQGVVAGLFFTIEKNWCAGDTVDIKLPMTIKTSSWFNNSVAVERGPLIYSLRIKERWQTYTSNDTRELKVPVMGGLLNREVFPESRWNYGLVVDENNPEKSFDVVMKNIEIQPFCSDTPPVILRGKGQILPEWTLQGNIASSQPFGPIPYNPDNIEDIELIPYGSARLKITHFPRIGAPQDSILRRDKKISTKNSAIIQEFANVIVPYATEYSMKIHYSGKGVLGFMLNGKLIQDITFPENNDFVEVHNLKNLIDNNAFKFKYGNYNNIRFTGNDDVAISFVEIIPFRKNFKITGSGAFESIQIEFPRIECANNYKISYGTEPGIYTNYIEGIIFNPYKGSQPFSKDKTSFTAANDTKYYIKMTAYSDDTELTSSDEIEVYCGN